MSRRVLIGPNAPEVLVDAVMGAGAEVVGQPDADAVVWVDPYDVAGLRGAVTTSTRWVSLPVAGVDRYLAAGLLTEGPIWTATKGVYGDAVAEHALALLLSCARHLHTAARRTTWVSDPGWRLRGQVVAVVGTGGIGRSFADKAHALGARCVGINRSGSPAPGFSEVKSVAMLPSALRNARAAVVCVPYTSATHGLIAADELSALGPDGVLVNVARGEVVDTEALVACLRSGRLGAAGIDTTDPEPLPDDHALWSEPSALVTCHNANPFHRLPWEQNVLEYVEHVRRNVVAFLAGGELNGVVDLAKGY